MCTHTKPHGRVGLSDPVPGRAGDSDEAVQSWFWCWLFQVKECSRKLYRPSACLRPLSLRICKAALWAHAWPSISGSPEYLTVVVGMIGLPRLYKEAAALPCRGICANDDAGPFGVARQPCGPHLRVGLSSTRRWRGATEEAARPHFVQSPFSDEDGTTSVPALNLDPIDHLPLSLPRVQQMPCPTKSSVWIVFFWHPIN